LIPERPEEAIALLQVLKGQVRTTISEIRRLVYALRPAVLDEFGLISAISDYTIPAHQSSSMHISLRAPETLPPLSAATEVAAFRIIEEAVTNVMRHAEARQCLIQLELTAKGELALSVTDDGKGLGDTYRTGVGMHSMRERSQELGGSFDIQTIPNGGTQIRVSLPITKEDIIWTPSVS
jgi:signal transduction histidine kinase